MDFSGEASTSDRNGSEAGSSSGRQRSREEFEREDLEANMQIVLAGGPVPGPREIRHRGPGPQVTFAEDWDGVTFKLAPSLHLSHRTISGVAPGTMRTFSGYTTAFERYKDLSAEVKSILLGSAFGPLIKSWKAVAGVKVKSKLVIIRAFLDRFLDTTNSFHLIPGLEASYDVSGFACMTGLPMGEYMIDWNGTPPKITDRDIVGLIGRGLNPPEGREIDRFSLIKSTLVNDYFKGSGACQTSSSEERLAHGEGSGEILLHPEMDYTMFARERLVIDTIERGDPDVMVDLPDFPVTVEYICGAARRTESVPEYTLVVTDVGMDQWGATIRKAAGAAYKRLWNVANRWRNLVAEKATRLCASEVEIARLREELAARDRIIEALRRGSSS